MIDIMDNIYVFVNSIGHYQNHRRAYNTDTLGISPDYAVHISSLLDLNANFPSYGIAETRPDEGGLGIAGGAGGHLRA